MGLARRLLTSMGVFGKCWFPYKRVIPGETCMCHAPDDIRVVPLCKILVFGRSSDVLPNFAENGALPLGNLWHSVWLFGTCPGDFDGSSLPVRLLVRLRTRLVHVGPLHAWSLCWRLHSRWVGMSLNWRTGSCQQKPRYLRLFLLSLLIRFPCNIGLCSSSCIAGWVSSRMCRSSLLI